MDIQSKRTNSTADIIPDPYLKVEGTLVNIGHSDAEHADVSRGMIAELWAQLPEIGFAGLPLFFVDDRQIGVLRNLLLIPDSAILFEAFITDSILLKEFTLNYDQIIRAAIYRMIKPPTITVEI